MGENLANGKRPTVTVSRHVVTTCRQTCRGFLVLLQRQTGEECFARTPGGPEGHDGKAAAATLFVYIAIRECKFATHWALCHSPRMSASLTGDSIVLRCAAPCAVAAAAARRRAERSSMVTQRGSSVCMCAGQRHTRPVSLRNTGVGLTRSGGLERMRRAEDHAHQGHSAWLSWGCVRCRTFKGGECFCLGGRVSGRVVDGQFCPAQSKSEHKEVGRLAFNF